jgi:hypothetical protein
MKHPIKRRDAGELRILAIALIAGSTELLAAALHGSATADVDAAIEYAVDRFVNRNEPATLAIAHGVQHARDRIMHREALLLCAWIFIAGAMA